MSPSKKLERAITSFIISERTVGGSDISTKTAIRNITFNAWHTLKSMNAKVGKK